MEIKEFTISDLKEAISQNTLWDTEIIPITKHRAIAQVNNPRADENDIVLLISYDNDNVIGYLGILPDKIFIDNIERKIGWLSAWWVDPSRRSTGIGRQLLSKALNHYDQNIALSVLSDDAKRVCDTSKKFITLRKMESLTIILRFNSNLLVRKIPKLKKFGPILKLLDGIGNGFINLRQHVWKLKNDIYKDIKIEFINEIDQETKQFITKHRKNELSKRDSMELNWIIKYPWILSAPLLDKESSKYYFSSVAKRFSFLNVKVFDPNDEMISFIMFKVCNNDLSIPYAYFDGKHLEQVIDVIGFFIIEMNINTFTTYNNDLIKGFKNIKFPNLFRKKSSIYFVISKKYECINFDNYYLQDGDGDCVFT